MNAVELKVIKRGIKIFHPSCIDLKVEEILKESNLILATFQGMALGQKLPV
jgi:hypothetical protein